MAKSIVLIGTLDTKGDQFAYLKRLIENRGHRAIVVDVGVMGCVPFRPSITREEVAQAGGSTLDELIACAGNEPKSVMDRMAIGAARVVNDLYARGEADGVLSGGGSMGTALALEVMKEVPLGVPKLIVSTVAHSIVITPDAIDGSDLMMVPWVAGLWGLNSISMRALRTAAGAICGAAEAYDRSEVATKSIVGVTSVGGSMQAYMGPLKQGLEERGYEVAVFHGTGMSGRLFEKAIADGLIAASVDLAVGGELTNYVAGGVCSAGPNRLEAAGQKGIPQIICADRFIFHWWSALSLPHKYRGRERSYHNTLFGPVRCSSEEAAAVGDLMAEKLNRAKGPSAVVISMQPPEKGQSTGIMKQAQWVAFRERFMASIKPEIEVVMLKGGQEDPAFVETILRLFDLISSQTKE